MQRAATRRLTRGTQTRDDRNSPQKRDLVNSLSTQRNRAQPNADPPAL